MSLQIMHSATKVIREGGTNRVTRDYTPLYPMSDAPTPDEVLEDLDDSDDDECIYLKRDESAYLWAAEDDDRYILLEQTRSGAWLPRGRPIDRTEAEYHLGETIESNVDTYEVRPQTALPPGRHRRDIT